MKTPETIAETQAPQLQSHEAAKHCTGCGRFFAFHRHEATVVCPHCGATNRNLLFR